MKAVLRLVPPPPAPERYHVAGLAPRLSRRHLALVKPFRAEALPRPGSQNWTLLEKALAKYRALNIYPSHIFDALEAALKANAGRLSGVWNDSFVRDLYETLQEALASGQSARDWLPEASKLIKAYGGATNLGIYSPDLSGDSFSAWYADLIFRQNTMNALNAGRYAEMFFGPAFETDAYWLFATAEDERVCPICGPLDGLVFSKIDAEGRHFLPGLHFNCVPADTRVEGLFRTGFRSLYSGEMVEIESEGGARLTVTGDHPVFTEAGLIPGRDLGEGARVFRYRVGNYPPARVNDENVPSRAAEVFGALEKAGARCEDPGRRVNLYGNAGRDERHVDVVTMDRELAHGTADHLGDFALVAAFAGDRAHHADGRASHLFIGSHSPAGSLPRSSALAHDSGPVHPRPFKGLRFGATALLDAALAECPDESPARHTALLGESLHGDSGVVALEKVIKVRKVDAVMRPVFDFEGAHGVIVAGGIVIGNCRCQAIALNEAAVRAGGYTVRSGFDITSPRPGFDTDRLDLVPVELRRAA